MRKIERTKAMRLAATALAALGLASCGSTPLTGEDADVQQQPSGPAVVRLVPAKSVYATEETVVVQVVIDNAWNVGSTPFHLRYDPAVLELRPPPVEGPFMSADGADTVFLWGSDPDHEGELVIGLSRLAAPQGAAGAGTLVVFEFQAVAGGNAGFAFTAASVKDPQAQNMPAAFDTALVTVE